MESSTQRHVATAAIERRFGANDVDGKIRGYALSRRKAIASRTTGKKEDDMDKFASKSACMALGLLLLTIPVLAGNPAVAHATGLRERIVDNHFRFVPAGDGPFPTIVAIPGCSGLAFQDPAAEADHPDLKEDDRLFRRHYPRTAERLRAEGFAVLLIHVHGVEGLVKACAGEIEKERLAQYIDEAVAWAKDLNFVDAARIYVMGWSMGGGGTLAWLHGARSQAGAVRSVVSVYPACSGREPLTSEIPLLMLLGGADDITDASVCEELVAASPTRSLITVRRYARARHGFDIADAPPVLEIGGGMTIGHQPEAAAAAWREILAFLSDGPP